LQRLACFDCAAKVYLTPSILCIVWHSINVGSLVCSLHTALLLQGSLPASSSKHQQQNSKQLANSQTASSKQPAANSSTSSSSKQPSGNSLPHQIAGQVQIESLVDKSLTHNTTITPYLSPKH
jgi:hypothetical protein